MKNLIGTDKSRVYVKVRFLETNMWGSRAPLPNRYKDLDIAKNV